MAWFKKIVVYNSLLSTAGIGLYLEVIFIRNYPTFFIRLPFCIWRICFSRRTKSIRELKTFQDMLKKDK